MKSIHGPILVVSCFIFVVTKIAILMFTIIPAVWIPAFRASRTELVDALAGGKL
ncbi:MAG: hypothetical protein JW904_00870 [Spirochaetales bacterium]|nr:hypothetical protein [Spirochaetales bacterium]